MSALDRQRVAQCTWWSECLALFLSVAYCVIVGHDLARAPSERLSSMSWFSEGFCNARWGVFNSHTLCTVGDFLIGGALFWENDRRYKRSPSMGLLTAKFTSFFTVMHGFGHLFFGHVLEEDFMASLRPSMLSYPALGFYATGVLVFLALGPFLGYCTGVRREICMLVHLVSAWVFLTFVPTQFAFGWVLLYLNLWYCAPRVLLVGCSKPEHVALRVDEGWDVGSYGFLALMPVVFAEMLCCDGFYKVYGGHFIYDGAILLVLLVYSVSLW